MQIILEQGVHQDIPLKLIEDIEKFCKSFPKIIDDLEGLPLIIEFLNNEM